MPQEDKVTSDKIMHGNRSLFEILDAQEEKNGNLEGHIKGVQDSFEELRIQVNLQMESFNQAYKELHQRTMSALENREVVQPPSSIAISDESEGS